MLDDGFGVVVWPRGELFSPVGWSCAAGAVVGSDSALLSTEHGGGCVLLFEERQAVNTGGRAVNSISGVGVCAGCLCWRCAVAAAFDVERIRRGWYGWTDEGREFL